MIECIILPRDIFSHELYCTQIKLDILNGRQLWLYGSYQCSVCLVLAKTWTYINLSSILICEKQLYII